MGSARVDADSDHDPDCIQKYNLSGHPWDQVFPERDCTLDKQLALSIKLLMTIIWTAMVTLPPDLAWDNHSLPSLNAHVQIYHFSPNTQQKDDCVLFQTLNCAICVQCYSQIENTMVPQNVAWKSLMV